MSHRALLQMVLLAAMNLIAGSAFLDVFRARDVLPFVMVCAGGPIVVGIALRLARPAIGLPGMVMAQVAAFLVVWSGLLVVSLGASPDLNALWIGWQDAWRTIATATNPAPPRPELLALPSLLLWTAGAVSVEIAERTASRILPVLPAVLVAIAATLLSAGQPAYTNWRWLLLAGLVLVLVATGGQVADPSSPGGDAASGAHQHSSLVLFRLAVLIPVTLLVVVAAASIVPQLSFVQPDEAVLLRNAYEADRAITPDLNPLATIGPTTGDPQTAFEVELSWLPQTTLRFRTAVLDRFDGNRWTSSAGYVPTGAQLGSAGSSGGLLIEQRYRIERLDGPYLPVLGTAVRLEVASDLEVLTDEVGSGLVVAGTVDNSGLVYSVASVIEEVDPVQLPNTPLQSSTEALGPSFSPPTLPESLDQIRVSLIGDVIDPFDQLALLREFFRNNEKVHSGKAFEVSADVQVPLNTFYVSQFVADGEDGRRGSPQMFAAAFTAMAQAQGIPARLAVGYVPSGDVDSRSLTLTDQDLSVWPEIAFQGIGWVAFDPVPVDDTDSLPLDQQDLDIAVGETVDQTSGGSETPPQPPVTDDADPDESAFTGAQIGAGLLALLALLIIAMPPTWKWRRRRRRRRAGTTADRVVAAWTEVVDRLVERGLTGRRTKTPTEVVASWSEVTPAGEDLLSQLAALADRAVNSKAEPAESDVELAWQLDELLSGEISERGRTDKLKGGVSLKSLVGSERS